MKTDPSNIRQRTLLTRNKLVIRLYGVWMGSILMLRAVPEFFVELSSWLRRRMTPKRAVLSAITVALIITPSVGYFVEHARYVTKRDAYRELMLASATETRFLTSSLHELLDQQERLTALLLDQGHAVRTGDRVTVKVVATGYSSTIAQTDSTPFITASNTQTRIGVLALSRDLLSCYMPGAPFSFGDVVHVSGVGDFIVEDTMNARWGNRVDVWFPARMEALRFGVRDVYLTLVEKNAAFQTGQLSESGAIATSANGL